MAFFPGILMFAYDYSWLVSPKKKQWVLNFNIFKNILLGCEIKQNVI